MKSHIMAAVIVAFVFLSGCTTLKESSFQYKFSREYRNFTIIGEAVNITINESNGTSVFKELGKTFEYSQPYSILTQETSSKVYLRFTEYEAGSPLLYLKEIYSITPYFTDSVFNNEFVENIKYWYDCIENRKSLAVKVKKQKDAPVEVSIPAETEEPATQEGTEKKKMNVAVRFKTTSWGKTLEITNNENEDLKYLTILFVYNNETYRYKLRVLKAGASAAIKNSDFKYRTKFFPADVQPEKVRIETEDAVFEKEY